MNQLHKSHSLACKLNEVQSSDSLMAQKMGDPSVRNMQVKAIRNQKYSVIHKHFTDNVYPQPTILQSIDDVD